MITVSIICLAILLIVNFICFRGGFYEKGILWFGRLMHFSGGFFVAMFVTGFTREALAIIGLTLAVGITWELGEYCLGLYLWKMRGTKKYMTEAEDTKEDLLFDVIGAVTWSLLYFAVSGH